MKAVSMSSSGANFMRFSNEVAVKEKKSKGRAHKAKIRMDICKENQSEWTGKICGGENIEIDV